MEKLPADDESDQAVHDQFHRRCRRTDDDGLFDRTEDTFLCLSLQFQCKRPTGKNEGECDEETETVQEFQKRNIKPEQIEEGVVKGRVHVGIGADQMIR